MSVLDDLVNELRTEFRSDIRSAEQEEAFRRGFTDALEDMLTLLEHGKPVTAENLELLLQQRLSIHSKH